MNIEVQLRKLKVYELIEEKYPCQEQNIFDWWDKNILQLTRKTNTSNSAIEFRNSSNKIILQIAKLMLNEVNIFFISIDNQYFIDFKKEFQINQIGITPMISYLIDSKIISLEGNKPFYKYLLN